MNKDSIKVLLKNGFKQEANLKKEIIFKNKRYDHYFFGKLI